MEHATRPDPPSRSGALRHRARRARLGRLIRRGFGHILVEDGPLLVRWRARLTALFLAASVTIGLVPALSAVALLARAGNWPLVVVDAALMSAAIWLLVTRRVSNRVRNAFLTAAALVIGVTALLTIGPFSTALGWLLIGTFLAAFQFGTRATIAVVVLVLAVLIGVGIGIEADAFAWSVGDPTAAVRWRLITLDATFLFLIFAGGNRLIMGLLEREDASRALVERQLAEARRHEALGTLAGGIAHDFNNLLVPMLANVEVARAALPAESPAHTALVDAQRTAERARDLVQRILAFGRGGPVVRDAIPLAEAAEQVVELTRVTLPTTVTLESRALAAPVVRAAAVELHQILHNLVGNAVHAVRGRGRITLTISLDDRVPGSMARLDVQDTGIGMDERTRARIFDPYFSTREPGRGTGLGLSIVRSLVESLGGQIDVASTPGHGSTFTVRLPVAAARAPGDDPLGEPRPATEPAAPRVPARSPRVLLVDDELGVRRATQRQLESLGASVVAVDGVPAALETLGDETASVDLVLTDHRMPDRSGVELAGEAHARWPALPIILMSGDVETALAELGTGLSVIPLQKPFSRRELAAAVDHALRRAGLDDAGAPPTHGVTAVGRAIPDSSAPPVSA